MLRVQDIDSALEHRLALDVDVEERAGGLGRDDATAAEEEPEAGRGSQKEGSTELQRLVPESVQEIATGDQGPEGRAAAATANGSEGAVSPHDSRALRQTAPTKQLLGGLYFTPDGRSLVHGGHDDKELSLWDLRTAKRAVGLERTGAIICSTISPDGSRLCVAAKDGLGMYRFPCIGGIGRPAGSAARPACHQGQQHTPGSRRPRGPGGR